MRLAGAEALTFSGTSDSKGELTLNNVTNGYYYFYLTPPEGHYGVTNKKGEFHVITPQTEEDLKDTLMVYLWGKKLPLPGTNEYREPSLIEIKEMAPRTINLQRALRREVHNLNETGEQLERARKFYAYVDSTVFNGKWGIKLKTNEPYNFANHDGQSFSLENMQDYWYNVITDGNSHTETDGSGDIHVARAPLQNYIIVGQAHIPSFQEEPNELPEIAKEIIFRIGKYGVVGSRESVGNATPSWPTETDRTLMYSYNEHENTTLTNNKVIYYTPYDLTE